MAVYYLIASFLPWLNCSVKPSIHVYKVSTELSTRRVSMSELTFFVLFICYHNKYCSYPELSHFQNPKIHTITFTRKLQLRFTDNFKFHFEKIILSFTFWDNSYVVHTNLENLIFVILNFDFFWIVGHLGHLRLLSVFVEKVHNGDQF